MLCTVHGEGVLDCGSFLRLGARFKGGKAKLEVIQPRGFDLFEAPLAAGNGRSAVHRGFPGACY